MKLAGFFWLCVMYASVSYLLFTAAKLAVSP